MEGNKGYIFKSFDLFLIKISLALGNFDTKFFLECLAGTCIEHKLPRVSIITEIYLEETKLCSDAFQFTDFIEAQRPDLSVFLKSSSSKVLHAEFIV